MKPAGRLIVVGTFSRVIKSDGTLLFTPSMSDSSFLLDIKRLYHSVFSTEWRVDSIKSVAKGFHIRLADVKTVHEAEYLVNESFSVPFNEIEGRSSDLLVGRKVTDMSGMELGETLSISKTPAYMLLEVLLTDGRTAYVPATEDFISTRDGLIILLKEPVL